MSDAIKHECGLAVVRLRKPLEYYAEKYGTPLWGFFRLFLLMEKQHNRGQDGAGVGAVKLDMEAGQPYVFRARSVKSNSLDRIFRSLMRDYDRQVKSGNIHPEFVETVKKNFEFGAELLLGHLRYGTSGGYSQKVCHPYFRKSNWPMRNLLLAGNFNMTNTNELNERLVSRGQHPIFGTDTQTILEELGYHLDEEHNRLYRHFRDDEGLGGLENSDKISRALDPARVLRDSSQDWDGGYSIGGLIGNGDLFVVRDPWGIRPLYALVNDEVIAYASERAPLMTVFQKTAEEVREVEPGTVEVVKFDGQHSVERIREPKKLSPCSFERIYFSRGNDIEIYDERKKLGSALVPKILEAIDNDLDKTVFSYIPNTSEVAYYGMMQGLRRHRRAEVKAAIMERMRAGTLTEDCLDELITSNWPRSEKVANKDIKLRTFISQEKGRSEMVSHVYDISYGSVNVGDTLVCLDDSIVRGTTLKRSIIKILARLKPSRIFIASTAPQIRYPDCYGIDMSELGNFIAFQAMVELLRENGKSDLLEEVYHACVKQRDSRPEDMKNHVKTLYDCFSDDQISKKISELVTPVVPEWDGEVRIVFQTIASLHESLPNNQGDWYFTGNYPTPGGYRALNRAYINFFEKRTGRSY
ncbi:amidophosphoribosyltransferase [Puniceicoccus vermicola]|uniref:Amidophosphoribosyltransferase n=1 Tax=Puniceicoccus vermicola TaxID=388746 RepID=A0A7X1E4E1_9BACT|nr:amidophosphoribosyltransferase [Puniceicoccus vermicola]MBC2602046.1 amidophosphoribosyltransferase [Puniceicoccus vermicola]